MQNLAFGERLKNAAICALLISLVIIGAFGGIILGVFILKSVVGFVGGLLGFGAGVGISHAVVKAATG